MSKLIPLTKGKVAIVDDEVFGELSQHNWMFVNGYAIRNGPRGKDGRKPIAMHRVIMEAQSGEHVDHINGDSLDNRRENMRKGGHAQNCHNRPGYGGASKYKGVLLDRRRNKWYARIKKKHLGSFGDEVDAALAYDEAARQLYGEFAWLNFPDGVQFERQRYTGACEVETSDSKDRPGPRTYRVKRVEVTCEECGRMIVRTEYFATRYGRNFCSHSCHMSSRNKATPRPRNKTGRYLAKQTATSVDFSTLGKI